MINQFVVATLIGFVMGVLTHAKRNKHIKMPKINKASWNPGFFLDGSFGSIASLVGVLVSAPTEMERVVLISILAGYAGEGLINRLAEKSFSENIAQDKEIQDMLNEKVKSKKD